MTDKMYAVIHKVGDGISACVYLKGLYSSKEKAEGRISILKNAKSRLGNQFNGWHKYFIEEIPVDENVRIYLGEN